MSSFGMLNQDKREYPSPISMVSVGGVEVAVSGDGYPDDEIGEWILVIHLGCSFALRIASGSGPMELSVSIITCVDGFISCNRVQ
jgi:hypothetical protein